MLPTVRSRSDFLFVYFWLGAFLTIQPLCANATQCLTCNHPKTGSPQCETPIRLTDFAPSVKVADLVQAGTLTEYRDCRGGCGRQVFTINEEAFVSFGCSRGYYYGDKQLEMDNCRRNEKKALSGTQDILTVLDCFRCDGDKCNSPEINPFRTSDVIAASASHSAVKKFNLGFVTGNVVVEVMAPDASKSTS
ncbi:uncharacterized protein LOC129596038 [Paramacrobiotus metropolitanus]|uniref:uncharacterized protein LOC129596038 n=1 Tax=Paramacrobiotus metropolitanus TaxID=2943436 RepID=UPI0024462772|nr:uncharacterized protein LOC129596038 [Paramacrobiotus metropolitanus]